MCGLTGFWEHEVASGGGRGAEALAARVTRDVRRRCGIAGLTTAGRGSTRRPGSRSGFRRLAILDLSPDRPPADGLGRRAFRHRLQRRDLQPPRSAPRARARRRAVPRHVRHRGAARAALGSGAGRSRVPSRLGHVRDRALGPRASARSTSVRDRLGKKPLYYGCRRGRAGSLLRLGAEGAARPSALRRRLDRDALASYFRYGYVPDPREHLPRGSQGCRPGAYLVVPRRSSAPSAPCAYWSARRASRATGSPRARRRHDAEALDALDGLLRRRGACGAWRPTCRSARSSPAASTRRRSSR